MAGAPRESGILAERLASPGLLLALLGQAAMRRLRAAHTAVGLSPRQFQILALLNDTHLNGEGPLAQRELGEKVGVDPSILVTMLNPLEEDGLVRRIRDRSDRRRHTVTLTSSGRRKLERAATAQRDAEDRLFGGLDDDEREQLRRLLLVLRDAGTCVPAPGDARGRVLIAPAGATGSRSSRRSARVSEAMPPAGSPSPQPMR